MTCLAEQKDKYMHIERFGTDNVEDSNIGECYIFPKIDGSNEKVWFKDGQVKCGNRIRELSLDKHNL